MRTFLRRVWVVSVGLLLGIAGTLFAIGAGAMLGTASGFAIWGGILVVVAAAITFVCWPRKAHAPQWVIATRMWQGTQEMRVVASCSCGWMDDVLKSAPSEDSQRYEKAAMVWQAHKDMEDR